MLRPALGERYKLHRFNRDETVTDNEFAAFLSRSSIQLCATERSIGGVCPSHVGIESKLMNLGSCGFHRPAQRL